MDEKSLARWKYRHDGPGSRSRAQWCLIGSLLLACLLTAKSLPPLAVILFGAALLALFYTRRTLLVGPRYLICGERILYFANIVRIERDDAAGRLLLVPAEGSPLEIERDKFPTNARKTAKIARNKEAKFTKVANHLVERVRQAAPGAEIRLAD